MRVEEAQARVQAAQQQVKQIEGQVLSAHTVSEVQSLDPALQNAYAELASARADLVAAQKADTLANTTIAQGVIDAAAIPLSTFPEGSMFDYAIQGAQKIERAAEAGSLALLAMQGLSQSFDNFSMPQQDTSASSNSLGTAMWQGSDQGTTDTPQSSAPTPSGSNAGSGKGASGLLPSSSVPSDQSYNYPSYSFNPYTNESPFEGFRTDTYSPYSNIATNDQSTPAVRTFNDREIRLMIRREQDFIVKEMKHEAQLQRQAEERRRQQEIERRAEEKRRQEEMRRQQEKEKKLREEAERRDEAKRRQEEDDRRAEEKRQREDEKRAEERRQREEDYRRAEEMRQREYDRIVNERRRKEEAEEKEQQEIVRKHKEEIQKREDEIQKCEDEMRRVEEEIHKLEEQARRDAERRKADEKRRIEETQRTEDKKHLEVVQKPEPAHLREAEKQYNRIKLTCENASAYIGKEIGTETGPPLGVIKNVVRDGYISLDIDRPGTFYTGNMSVYWRRPNHEMDSKFTLTPPQGKLLMLDFRFKYGDPYVLLEREGDKKEAAAEKDRKEKEELAEKERKKQEAITEEARKKLERERQDRIQRYKREYDNVCWEVERLQQKHEDAKNDTQRVAKDLDRYRNRNGTSSSDSYYFNRWNQLSKDAIRIGKEYCAKLREKSELEAKMYKD